MKNNFSKSLPLLKKIKPENLTTFILMVFLCLLAYGILIPGMGFYWDDWVFAWTINFLGPKEFIPSFLPFRPFLGPIFTLTTSVLGASPLIWQIFGLFIRLGTGLAAFWSFQQLWPKAKLQVMLASLFFIVFPGYNQQWVALTHVNQELIPLIAYLLSLGFMVKAVKSQHPDFKFTLIALFFTFLGLYPTEYFFGLELLRPFILWLVFREKNAGGRTILRKTILCWLPYLALWLSNAIFLYLYHNSSYYQSYGLSIISFSDTGFKALILHTMEDFIHAIITTGFDAWANTIGLITNSLSQTTTWATLGLVGISFIFLFSMVLKANAKEKSSDVTNSFGWQAIMLGLIGIIAGRIPSWLAGLPLQIEFSWDRFMLSTMLGGSLLIIGLVDYLIQDKNRKILVACLLISFAVGWQFTKANSFRREWENQRQLFWQLSWRIPALKPNTLIVTHELPFMYVTDQSLTAALNWVYAPQITSHDLPYMLAYTKARLGSGLLPGLQTGMPISSNFRTMTFNSTTDSVVVIFQENPGCVRVMDSVYSNKDTVPGVTYMLSDAIPLSNLDQIISNAPQPTLSTTLFGREPQHIWCYFFEKAELARQMGKWEEVVHLGDDAFKNGFQALQPAENLVFIEAYALNTRMDEAIQLSRDVATAKPNLKPALCDLWHRVQTSQTDQKQIIDFLAELQCEEQ